MVWQLEGPEPQRPPGTPPDEPPQGDQPRWTWRRSVLAMLIAAGIAAGGGAVVYALSGSTGTERRGPTGSPPGYGQEWRAPGGPMSRYGPDGAVNLRNALHGEFVVAQGGGYVTKVMHTGELVEASDGSLTVRSDDGFTRSYVLSPGTVWNEVATGDIVRVVATKSGDVLTTESVSGNTGPAPPTR